MFTKTQTRCYSNVKYDYFIFLFEKNQAKTILDIEMHRSVEKIEKQAFVQ